MTSASRVAPDRVRRRAGWPVLYGVGVLAAVTAAALSALSVAESLTATGLPDPGPVTNYGLPAVRAAGEIAAVTAVGSFLFAAFLVPPQKNGCGLCRHLSIVMSLRQEAFKAFRGRSW